MTNIYSPIDGTVLNRNVSEGQKATFTVDAFPDETFNGSVSEVRLQPTVSSNVVNYTTIINADNSSLKLKPGMTANITIYTQVLKNVMKIPVAATSFRPDSLVMKKYKVGSPFANGKGKRKGSGPKKEKSGMENKSEAAGVWVIGKDSIITRKRIRTGMNNDTEIQVISGLDRNDNIFTGYKNLSKKPSGNAAKSPFMPQRRDGGSGGGNRGGGGGPR